MKSKACRILRYTIQKYILNKFMIHLKSKDYPIFQRNLLKYVFVLNFFIFIPLSTYAHNVHTKASNTSIILSSTEKNWLATHKNIVVAFDSNFPPYSYVDEQGRIAGMSVDYFNLMAKKTGVTFSFSQLDDWQSIHNDAIKKEGEIDVIATMVNLSSRQQWFNFTQAYIFKSLVIVTNKRNKSIAKKSDISDKTVALVNKYQYAEKIIKEYPNIVPYYVNSIKDGLEAVSAGKAQAMIAFLSATEWYKDKYFLSNLHVAAFYDKNSSNESIAIRKTLPELTSILQKALNAISVEEKHKIAEKWLPDLLEHKTYQNIIRDLAIVSAIALALFLMVIYLRRKNKQISSAEYSAKLANEKLVIFSNSLEEQVKERTEKLFNLSYFDPLTKLANKNLFYKKVGKIINEYVNTSRSFALLFLDINRFKYINDNLGHKIGDDVIKKIAARLTETLKIDDVIARSGGGEFTVVLTDIDAQGALNMVRRLLMALKEPYLVHSDPINLTFSVGVAMFPENGVSLNSLMQRSNAAMYLAKEEKSGVVFSDTQLVQKYTDHLQLEQALLHAIHQLVDPRAEPPFELYYQPIKWLNKKGVKGFEALIRWHHNELGWINPQSFISLAEEIGHINEISHWVRLTAFEQARKWFDQGLEFGRISVNLSPIELQNPKLISLLKEEITQVGSRFEWVEIEITETAILKNPQVAIDTLISIKQLGAHISIDDFGTGYSSLVYLKKIPANTVKIDREFIKNLPHDLEDLDIDKTIITLCHSLGKVIVAEGVENIEQLNLLQSLGCDSIQGYYISKAVPANMIQKHNPFFSDINIQNDNAELL